MRKDKGRIVEEVFTPTGRPIQVKVNVTLYNLKQALALRAIITSFEASALRSDKGNGKGSTNSTPV